MVGDGGGFSGYSGGGDYQDRLPRGSQFEEYDEFDDGGARAVQRSSIPRKSPSKKEVTSPVKDVDLFSFDDDTPPISTTSNAKGKGKETLVAADDDFDDFQSATDTTGTSTTATTTTTATTANTAPSVFSPPPIQSNPIRPNVQSNSTTSSLAGFGISSPPVQQPTRSPNPPSFGFPPPSSTTTVPPISTANYQPNYFSQPLPTTVPLHLVSL
jgi:epsin